MKKKMNESMCKLLSLFAFILFSMHCSGDNGSIYLSSLNRAEYDLKGSVYAVIVKDCQFKKEFGEIIRTGSKDKKIYFLSNGKVYKEQLSPGVFKKYLFDDHGYLTGEMIIQEKGEGQYKNNGESFINNDTIKQYIYENIYGPSGNIKEILKKEVAYNYLEQTERIVFSDATGGLKYTCYDKYGVIREFSRKNNIEKLRVKNSNIYYEWLIITTVLNNKGRKIKSSIVYERLNGSTFMGNSESYVLDARGNIIKSSFTSSQQKRDPSGDITVKYQYDNNGNWTSKKQYRGGKLISWEEREIFYATDEKDYNNIVEEDARKAGKQIYTSVEKIPSFPGGADKIVSCLHSIRNPFRLKTF